MSTAEQVQQFFDAFLEAEREALFSKYSDADDAYAAALAPLLAFWSPAIGLPGTFYRSPAPPGTDFDVYAPNRAQIRRRQLFKLKRWRHPDGDLYGAWTGSNAGNPSYHTLFFAREIDGRLRVVAEYGVCIDCWSVDPACERCQGRGWERMHGLRLDVPGPGPVEWSRKLTPPRGPELADYDGG